MARLAPVASWTQARAWTRAVRRCAAAVALLSLFAAAPSHAQAVKGAASMSVSGGYARIVLKLAEDVESEVTQAGTVLVIRFKRPVDVPVDILSDAAPDYIGSARRDPDGSAIRLALSRKVTVNSMVAGERIFIDLLPDSWKGMPPGLPQDVVKELSDRARAAERALRQQRAASEGKQRPAIRVRASVQPTFVRFVFEMPDGVGVSSTLNEKTMTLTFNAGLVFDLADAKLSAPPNVASIGQAMDGNRTAVEIGLIGDVDVHSFREEKNYVVDIGFQQPDAPAPSAKLPAARPPAADKPVTEVAPSPRSGVIVPPTSEAIALESKPGKVADVAVKVEPAKVEPVKAELPKAELPKVEAAKAEVTARPVPAPVAVMPAPVAEPAPAPVPAVAPATASVVAPAAAGESAAMAVEVKRSSDGLRMSFDFTAPTPAALFRRGDIMWLVFDSARPIDVAAMRREGGSVIADASIVKLEKGQAVRMRLNRPQLASLTPDDPAGTGQSWSVMFADTRQTQSLPLSAIRNIADPAHANVQVPLARPGLKHRLVDPDAGDTLDVI
ncbi:MAG: tetratricopeptide repeat protein, partial [Tardiphaga sp.]